MCSGRVSDLQHSALSTLENQEGDGIADTPHQSISRSVAASLPPSIALVRRLVSGSLISSSTLSRLSDSDRRLLMEDAKRPGEPDRYGWIGDEKTKSFQHEYFTRALQCAAADIVFEVWEDPRFIFAPAHIVHPVATLAGELITSLDEASKAPTKSATSSNREDGQWGLFSTSRLSRLRRQREEDGEDTGGDGAPVGETDFEPSMEAISHLIDMGFSWEQALDALESTRSNRLEVAMEYALSHGQVSVAALERRRSERGSRRRGRSESPEQGEDTAAAQEEPAATTTVLPREMGPHVTKTWRKEMLQKMKPKVPGMATIFSS